MPSRLLIPGCYSGAVPDGDPPCPISCALSCHQISSPAPPPTVACLPHVSVIREGLHSLSLAQLLLNPISGKGRIVFAHGFILFHSHRNQSSPGSQVGHDRHAAGSSGLWSWCSWIRIMTRSVLLSHLPKRDHQTRTCAISHEYLSKIFLPRIRDSWTTRGEGTS